MPTTALGLFFFYLQAVCLPAAAGLPPLPPSPVANEPWSQAEHKAAVASALEAADALPLPVRAALQIRLADALEKAGDRDAQRRLLRQIADTLHTPSAQLAALTQRLVQAGDGDRAYQLMTAQPTPQEMEQAVEGTLNGAVKAGDADLGVRVFEFASKGRGLKESLSVENAVNGLVDMLLKKGRFRDALILATWTGHVPLIAATVACAADPALAAKTSSALAFKALDGALMGNLLVDTQDTVSAYASCRGFPAAERLVAAMPVEVADKIDLGSGIHASVEYAETVAAEAFAVSKTNSSKADRLFAQAKTFLEHGVPRHGTTRKARNHFDAAATKVAVLMAESGRTKQATALVAPLPALEQLPILFAIAQTVVAKDQDLTIVIGVIQEAFTREPALIKVEAYSIRTLAKAIRPGSPFDALMKGWLDVLPPLPSLEPPIRAPKSVITQPTFFATALAKALPSFGTVERVVVKAQMGMIDSAVEDAKRLELTPAEKELLRIGRAVIESVPDLDPFLVQQNESAEFDIKKAAAATPADTLLIAVERAALNAKNVAGAEHAAEAVSAGSPIKPYATKMLALAMVKDGRPHKALALWAEVKDPAAAFTVLTAIVTVRPTD